MNLLTMRQKLRRKLDELSESFWEDDELDDYLNEGYFHYWQWMLNARYQRCRKSVFLNIVANNEAIVLPSDFAIADRVEQVRDSVTVPLRWRERFDEPNYTNGAFGWGNYTVTFEGASLILEPTPGENVTGGIKLRYFYFPVRLVNDGDSPDAAFLDFYQDIIIGQAVLFAKAKEEAIGQGGADLGPFGALLSAKEQKFKETIELPTIQRQAVEQFVC